MKFLTFFIFILFSLNACGIYKPSDARKVSPEGKQRVKQNQIEIPLVISDHSDWTELTKTIINSNAERIWVTHGNEEGLVYWIKKRGLDAQPLSIQGRGEDKD